MVFVPLGPRSGSWTSHHGVAGCGSLQKGRWPTSSWRTGPQVKAREALLGLRCLTSYSVKGEAARPRPVHSRVMGTDPGNRRTDCTFKLSPSPLPQPLIAEATVSRCKREYLSSTCFSLRKY